MAWWLGWIILSVVAAIAADSKGRSGLSYFFLSLFLSPVIGLILVLVAPPNYAIIEKEQIASGHSKRCPQCAEVVKKEAKVCKHCGHALLPAQDEGEETDTAPTKPTIEEASFASSTTTAKSSPSKFSPRNNPIITLGLIWALVVIVGFLVSDPLLKALAPVSETGHSGNTSFASVKKAAERGEASAQTKLGVCFHEGKVVPKDVGEAIKWWRKAADQNDAEAQYFLGGVYYFGDGVPKDFTEAQKWLQKSADQGNSAAKDTLNLISATSAKAEHSSDPPQSKEKSPPKSFAQLRQEHMRCVYDGFVKTHVPMTPQVWMLGCENGMEYMNKCVETLHEEVGTPRNAAWEICLSETADLDERIRQEVLSGRRY